LTNLCNETKWTNGLWLHYHSRCGINNTSVCGGLNNARNRIQTRLRLAMDAGASLILPSATTRDEKNLVATDDKAVWPDMFWDIKYLQTSLPKQCPQLQIRHCDDRTGIDKVVEAPQRSYVDPAYVNGEFRKLVVHAFDESNMNEHSRLASCRSKLRRFIRRLELQILERAIYHPQSFI